jgi:hypothetical protein
MPELWLSAYICWFVMSQNALIIVLDHVCLSVLVLKGQRTVFLVTESLISCCKDNRNPSCLCAIKLSVLADLWCCDVCNYTNDELWLLNREVALFVMKSGISCRCYWHSDNLIVWQGDNETIRHAPKWGRSSTLIFMSATFVVFVAYVTLCAWLSKAEILCSKRRCLSVCLSVAAVSHHRTVLGASDCDHNCRMIMWCAL